MHHRQELVLDSSDTDALLRVVVVADTHGQPHPLSQQHITAEHPSHILHAGDIGDLNVLRSLAQIAPLTAVRGNIDGRVAGIPDVATIDVRTSDQLLVRILLIHIGVYGAYLRSEVARLAKAEGAGIVVCGHSHVPFLGRDKGITMMNPGSVGPRRFQLPILFGVMDIRRSGVSMHHVNCETGQRWEP